MKLRLIRNLALISAASLGLAGCNEGYGYGGMSYGYGSYYDDYYGGGYYGGGSPYYGWYDGWYYPGNGYYVYDRAGTRRNWNGNRAPWQGRSDGDGRRDGNWQGHRNWNQNRTVPNITPPATDGRPPWRGRTN